MWQRNKNLVITDEVRDPVYLRPECAIGNLPQVVIGHGLAKVGQYSRQDRTCNLWLSQRLAEYVRASFTGLWIESHEHEDALAEIAQQ
jgi:hypothetical protein